MSQELLYTVARSLPADGDEKPNALLFASPEKISDDTMEKIFNDPAVRAVLPKDKPALCIRYRKDEDARYGFLPEWRVVVTTLSHFMVPLNDNHDHVSAWWEEVDASGNKTGLVRKVNYKDLLESCIELYRTVGCDGCAKKGRGCVEQQLGGPKPWAFTFSYNRRDEWSATLAEEGTINDRRQRNTDHEFTGTDLAEIMKKLKKTQVEGYAFIDPAKTKLCNSPKMNHPLRPCRDHRFYKDPEHKAADSDT